MKIIIDEKLLAVARRQLTKGLKEIRARDPEFARKNRLRKILREAKR